jgi:hypothetical protein
MNARALSLLVLVTGGCAARTLPQEAEDLSNTVADAVFSLPDLSTIPDLSPQLPFPPVPLCKGLGESTTNNWCFAGPRFGCIVVADGVPPVPCYEVPSHPPPPYLYLVDVSQGCASCPPP